MRAVRLFLSALAMAAGLGGCATTYSGPPETAEQRHHRESHEAYQRDLYDRISTVPPK
jgi:hypothetical protein